MKVLHTIGGFTARSGGTSTCTYDLLRAIHAVDRSAVVDLLTPDATSDSDPLMGEGEGWIKSVPYDYRTPLAYSGNIHRFLKNEDYDLYHTNGMWLDVNHSTCRTARSKGKPYIITPHGMLYPEALKISYWKKWPLMKLWYERDIRDASCIHVTCEKEMEHIRRLGYHGPVAVIANPVHVPDFTEKFSLQPHSGCAFWRVGFLGRLHAIKKVENLLYGVSQSGRADVEIFIIGKGDDEYERFLNAEAQRLGLQDRVKFAGFLKGEEKFKMLAQLDALFVPSDMENFGMIVPEALLVGTPVMASLGTPWQSLNENDCGWWTDNSPASISSVINEIAATDRDSLHEMGLRGRKYVIDTFSDRVIAGKMLELYSWVAGEIEKPEFVYEN